MVHLFEWKWSDIAVECERFLGPKGYAGVQVSPIQENIIIPKRPWWERYQPLSYHWMTRSGNEAQFRDMVRRCNKAGVRIYVDIIINHMSAQRSLSEAVIGTGNSTADLKTKNYTAVPYNHNDFHTSCTIDNWNDPFQVRNCELVGLHDLDQSSEYVRKKIVDFINDMIDAGVAGIRVDAAKHIWPKDLAIIYSRLHNLSTEHDFPAGARPYIYQEVIDMGSEVISKYEYNSLGAVTEFKYGLELSRGIRGENPLKWFKNIGEEWGLLSRKDALIFIDNHDTQRSHNGVTAVLTHKEARLYKMAVAFMLAHPYGNPRVMSSFAFDDFDQGPPADVNGNILTPIGDNNSIRCADGWICEHRWSQIVNMVGFRNTVAGTEICEWWDNWNNQIAFSRGNRGFIAINAEKYDLNKRIKTCLPEGTYCDIISGDLVGDGCTGKRLIVDINGFANVNIVISDQDQVVAFHINARIN
ncbi:alpha-amylase 1 [Microplitis demolitor]|uniref:alpha-amylase 1 n=1 Tax=Microplitis demolitor TaxID=69319 RepID=UPI0004CD572C|nr:alpha-amylase 1 [Microplitis demolitor]